MPTDEKDLLDGMYRSTGCYRENGRWMMIFGVDTAPAYRRRGCAARLMKRVIAGREGRGQGGRRADLQGASDPLLRAVRVPERGPVRVDARRGNLVPDAADLLEGLLRSPRGRGKRERLCKISSAGDGSLHRGNAGGPRGFEGDKQYNSRNRMVSIIR